MLVTPSAALARGSKPRPEQPRGRVWVLARASRPGCVATVGVHAAGHTVSLRVRGTTSKRYVTALLVSRDSAIRTTGLPGSRCRALVAATGTLSLKRARHSVAPTPVLALTSPLGAGEAPTGVGTAAPAPAEPRAVREGVVLGTFDVVGEAEMRAWAAAGGTAVVVPIIWAAAQPTPDGPVSLLDAGNSGQDVLSEIDEAHTNGLQVYLELDLQYPPEWVMGSVPRYVNQAGRAFSSEVPGQDVRDWVWSQSGREAVASFVSGAMSALGPTLSDVAGIRAGGGMDGEMQYPDDGSTVAGQPSFWGYDLPAQTGAGLAEGEQSTPLPGYVYGQGSPAQDATWASWYEGSLGEFVHWYITQLRDDGWQGPVYVLEPSYGLRENWAPRSFEYEQQVALGTDYAVQMDSYDTLANVWPWSTWADDAEPYYRPGDSVESDMAAWRELLVLARQRGIAARIMGENTGGGGSAAIERLTGGALAAGYRGIFYLDYPTLTADGDSLLDALTTGFRATLAALGE